MSRKILGLLTILFPIFVFFAVFQVFRFQSLKQEIAVLEAEQKELFELNRDALSAAAVYSSPARLDLLAEQELGLSKIERDRILKTVTNSSPQEGSP